MTNLDKKILVEEVVEDSPAILEEIQPFGLENWNTPPLPPKQTVANFYDGNQYRIVYQFKENEYKMLTFNMEEGCKIYWGNLSYGDWYFSDRNKASNFMLYPLTVDGIGEGVTVAWNSSTGSVLHSNTSMAYKRNVECIFFSNTPIYDRDQTTVLYESQNLADLFPHYFQLKSVGFDPNCRIKVGETWEDLIQIDSEKEEETTIQSISFGGDYQPSYEKKGTYYLTAHIKVEQQPDEVFSYPFFINIYHEEFLAYPNNLPFPIEDGTLETIVYQSKGNYYLITYTATAHIHLYQYSATRLDFFDAHPDGGYGVSTGDTLYLLEDNHWIYQPAKQQRPYRYPLSTISYTNVEEDILYSTVNIYSKNVASDENLIRLADAKLPRKDYEIGMRYYEIPFKLPSVSAILKEHSSNHYFISYQTKTATLCVCNPSEVEDFHLRVSGGSTSDYVLAPSVKLNAVHYYTCDGTTEDWVFKASRTNATGFNTTYIPYLTDSFKMNGSSISTDLSLNERVAYTTIPIYIRRSVDSLNEPLLVRHPDNKLVADENSIPPVVLDILTGQEEPYTVDTKFKLAVDCEFEEIEGNYITKTEWENNQKIYPVGDNLIRARVRDYRELWSEWFEKTITIAHPTMSANAILGVHNLPLQTNGEPYDHYFVFKYHATSSTPYRCWGFVAKEGVEEFKVSVSGSNINFNQKLNLLFDKVDYYTGYDSIKGWGNATTLNLGYNSYNGGVLNGLASNIYYSTFPIYANTSYNELLAHPLTTVPPLPFAIALTTSHEDVWTTDDVTIQYEIDTMGQEIKEIKYRVNNEEFIALTETIGHLTFNQSGIYTVEVVAVNQQDVAATASTQFRIDKDAPTLEVTEQSNRFSYLIKEEHSGIQSVKYRLATIDGVEQNNTWTSGSSNGTLNKPIHGGVYVYEFQLTDNVGNTAIREFVFDLPKIPIKEIVVEPASLRMKYGASQKLTISYLPTDHNEEVNGIIYESLTSELISVTNTGVVSVASPYVEGNGQIKITVNEVEAIVPVEIYIERLAYPDTLPPLYDLYWYDQFTDFIIAIDHNDGYKLYMFNHTEEDAIFCIRNVSGWYRLSWSIPNHVSDLKTCSQKGQKWSRQLTGSTGAEYSRSAQFKRLNPNECVLFSTIDLYSDLSGTVLARPKDALPSTQLTDVLLNLNGYNGEWVQDHDITVSGIDTGGGIGQVTYSLDGGATEIEVENGGKVEFPKTGTYQVLAAVYNQDLAPRKVVFNSVKIDRDLPTVTLSRYTNSSTKEYSVRAQAKDTHGGIRQIRYRLEGGEWAEALFDNVSSVDQNFFSIPHVEFGNYVAEFEIIDAAGNILANSFAFEVPRPTPSSITVKPNPIEIRVGKSLTLDIQVNVEGRLEEGEITITEYDDTLIAVDEQTQTLTGLAEGQTTIKVNCRGVYRSVRVTVLPAADKPVINSLTVSPKSILTGDEVTFSYQATFDVENGAEFVEERWTGDKREIYDEAGTYSVGLEILDSNGLWSDKVEVTFTVIQRISIQSITVEPNPIVGVAESSKPINVSYSPTNAHNKNLVYTVENPAVATYEDGRLIFHEAGETTLIVASEENESVHTRVPIQVFNPSPVKLKVNNRLISLMLSQGDSPVRVKQNNIFKSLLLADDLPNYTPSRQVKVRVNGEWKLLVIEQDL